MTATAPRIAAAIDVGTNSVKIIVVDASADCERLLYENTLITRLGEGMQAYGMRLKEAAIRRTLDALEELVQQARAYGAEQIAAVGTAALREAQNRTEFLQRAQERLGLTIEIISGQEEARLSYLAVRRDPVWRESPHLTVVDIGGGSTEVIVGASEGKNIAFRVSLDMGAVRLTERFLRSDPPTLAQLDGASRAIREALEHLPVTVRHRPCTLVGVGGTIANLAAIDKGGVQSAQELHHHVIPVTRTGTDFAPTRHPVHRREKDGSGARAGTCRYHCGRSAYPFASPLSPRGRTDSRKHSRPSLGFAVRPFLQ